MYSLQRDGLELGLCRARAATSRFCIGSVIHGFLEMVGYFVGEFSPETTVTRRICLFQPLQSAGGRAA